jgi:TP901 family phage tail tape measure protein
MADVNANIGVNIDTSAALANLKNLQRQISAFHTSMAKSGAAASAVSAGMQQNLINSINQTGKFNASMQRIRSTTESFTNSLEKNKLGMREYFRYSAASTRTFGRFFRTEFDTINKVARERVKTLQTQYIKMGRDANGAMRAIAIRPVALDMQNLATQTQIAAQRQALFNQLVRQGSTNLLNFGKNTQWAGRQLMVGFTVPLTMIGAVAAKTFMQIEEQAIRFRKVYGEMFTSDTEVDKAFEDIKNLAKEFTKYGIAVEKTIQMAADAAQAGSMGKALEAQVIQATRLAILGGMEQEKALEATIALQNAFRVSTDDLAGSINFLNAVENQTVLSLEDIAEAIPRVGPIITELGGDIKDLAFFLTAMKEGGVSAAQGANALKAGLGRLINPTAAATEYLSQFNINLKAIIENNAGDLRATVLSFAQALEPLDELDKARAVEKVFGKFQFARTLALLNNITRDGTQASRVLKLTGSSIEELAVLSERELKQVEDSTTFRFKKALEEIKLAISPVGEEFLKAITPLLEFGSKILKQFDGMGDGAKSFLVNIVGIGGILGPLFLMMFGLIANGFANLIKMFAFLGRAFTGMKGSTKDLAAQTQYMTQEQLEAAAVAASLNQTHMKLRQTFTSEATAVNALTQAYQRATTAQAAFNSTAIVRTRTRGPKATGYASGVVSVPGPKGAGDIVPAMLSPGEAVIPAKMAKKYAPLIQGMVAGSIQGFYDGTNDVKKQQGRLSAPTPPKPSLSSQYIPSPFDKPIDVTPKTSVSDKIRKKYIDKVSGKEFSSAPGIVSKQTQAMSWASMDAERKAKEAALAKWEKENSKKLTQGQRNYVLGASDTAHTRSSSYKVNVGGQDVATKSWMAKSLMAEDRAINRYAQKTTLGPGGTDESRNILRSFMKKEETSKLAKQLGLKESTVSSNLKNLGMGISPKDASGLKVMQAVAAKDKSYVGAAASSAAQARLNYEKQNPGKGFFATRGQRGYNPAFDEQVKTKQAASVGKLNESLNKEIKAVQAGTKVKVQETKQIKKNTKIAKTETKSRETTVKNAKVETKAKTESTKATKAETKIKTTQTKVTMRETKQGQKFYVGNRLATDQKAARTSYNRSQGAMRAAETRRANSAARASMGSTAQGQKPGMSGRVLGGVGAAGMVGVMGASMAPGKVGEVAQQMMMPVMMLSMLLPMLSNPIGIVAAGLIAVVGGFVAVHLALEGIRRESSKTARSLGSGKEAMSKFAEAAGTVTPSEFMDKRRELEFSPFTVQTGKTTFGQAFVQTEAGEGMLADFEKQVEQLGRSKAIESLQKKLVTAVATGVLSPEQAKSIANSFGQKLNDYNITANINASIQSILGPDGKLLDGNTIKIYTEFVQESGTGLTGIGGILQTEELTGGAPFWWWNTAEVAKKEGEAAGIIANFYDENQQIVDAFDAENLKNIDKLYEENKYEEALAAEEKYQIERKALIDSYNIEINKLMDDFAGVGGNKKDAILRQLIDTAKLLDPTIGTAADRLREAKVSPIMVGPGAAPRAEQVAQQEAFKEAKLTFIAQLAAGNIDPKAFNSIMGMFDPTTSKGQATLGVLAKITTEVGPAAVEQLDTVFKVLENPDLAAEIAVNISEQDPGKAQDAIDTLTKISQFDGVAVEPQVVVKFYGEDSDKLDALTEKFIKLKDLKDKGTLDIESLITQKIITEGDRAAFEKDGYYEGLTADQKVVFTQVYSTQYETVLKSPDIIQDWRNQNSGSGLFTDEQVAAFLVGGVATQYTAANTGTDTTVVDDEETPITGGGAKEDPYKNLLTQLKQVRQNAVNAAGGIQELVKWLGKGKDINVFKGTQNALIKAGTSREFQDFVLTLDEMEQRNLFELRKGVVNLTKEGKALQRTFGKISIGQFVVEQQNLVQDAKNYQIAFARLRKSGMSAADAMELLEEEGMAAGIAMTKLGSKGQKEIQKIINAANKGKIALATMTPEAALGTLVSDIGAQINSINLDFQINVASDQSAIAAAQDDISKLQYKIDDYQASLQEIAWQEDEINKKYKEQFDALDKIKEASSQISEQKKMELTLADALTQGDIAGAARAAQELRAKQAQDAIEGQEKAMSLAQEAELAALRDSQGRTRLQIEQLILETEKQIFEIEEKRLEPAQERVRQAEVLRDMQIANLELQKAEYEDLIDNLKKAQRQTDIYKQKLKQALAVLQAMAAVELPSGSPGSSGNTLNAASGGMVNYYPLGGKIPYKAAGGMVSYYPLGGMIPYKADGGMFNSVNSDSVPAMLTPGEYVIKRQMVNKYGTKLFDKLNGGMLPNFGQNRYRFNTPAFANVSSGLDIDPSASAGNSMAVSDNSSVYNSYSVNVNVSSTTNPNEIARVVMKEIKNMDNQGIRSNNF